MPSAKTDNNIEPTNALKNPSTSNPGAIAPASINNSAFIIREKSPSVRILIGKVMISKSGFIKVFISAIIIHTNIALMKFSTSIPGTTHDTNIIDSEYATHLKKVLSMF